MFKVKTILLAVLLATICYMPSSYAQTSVWSGMAVVGQFNGWHTTPNMMLIANNTWQSEHQLFVASNQFKFVANNNWVNQWGDTNQSMRQVPITGIAEAVGGHDIVITNAIPGRYLFTFDASTREYSIQRLYTDASGVNIIQNSNFEQAGTARERASHWQWGSPDNHGGYWSDNAQRQDFRRHSGTWAGTLCSQPVTNGDKAGGWWQEGPATPDLQYKAAAWFWADPTWTAGSMMMKLEFYDTNQTLITYASTSIDSITNTTWRKRQLTAVAPAKTAWARVVIFMTEVGTQGAIWFDDVELRRYSTREQDFNYWTSFTNESCHSLDWELCPGHAEYNTIPPESQAGVFMSEYVEGSSQNKAIEVFNGSTNSIDLSTTFYYLQGYNNGSLTPRMSVRLTNGIIAPQAVYIVANPSASADIRTNASQLYGLTFSGDDSILLRRDSSSGPIIDRFGRVGETPGAAGWNSITTDHTLRRKATVRNGDTNYLGAFDPSIEWDVYPKDDSIGLGFHLLGPGPGGYTPSGLSASLATNIGSFLQSGDLSDGGIGTVSFWYKAVTNTPVMNYAIQTSPDGTAWTDAGYMVDVSSTSFEYYSLYINKPEHRYVRLYHLDGTNRLLIDDIQVAYPNTVRRTEDFNMWDSPTYITEGNYSFNGWSVSNAKISSAYAHDKILCAYVATNGSIQSPLLPEGAGAVSFWLQSLASTSPVDINVEFSSDGINWTTERSITHPNNLSAFYSIYAYATNPTYVRLFYVDNPDYPNHPYALFDQVEVRLPVVYRSQNFNSWPRQTSYSDSEYQGWSVHGAVIGTSNALSGFSARLDNTFSNHATIRTPRFQDGIGTITFQYRKWSESETDPRYEIQVSTNGSAWNTITNMLITNASWQAFSLYYYSYSNQYLRFYHLSGAGRALFDEINIAVPTPPANVELSAWVDPQAPFTNDTPHIMSSAYPSYGAQNISVTGYYRLGTAGAFTATSLQLTNYVLYRSMTTLPPQPPGSVVQYYIQSTFNGPGSYLTSPQTYPSSGTNAPLSYTVPRSRSGQVWINELSYINYWEAFWDTNEFIELCGPAGMDISGWTIELVYGDQVTNATVNGYAHYRVPNGIILNDETNGFGFYTVGDVQWGELMDQYFTNLTKEGWAENNFADGNPDGVRICNEVGGIEYALSYGGYIPNFQRIVQNQTWETVLMLALKGTGSVFTNFTFALTNGTPGRINAGQTLIPPPEPPEYPPTVDLVRVVIGTNITITAYGNTNSPSWAVQPYYTTNLPLNNPQWLAVSPFFSTYAGGTNVIWFDRHTNGQVYFYRVLLTKP